MTKREIARKLKKALNLLSSGDKWIQGRYDDNGAHCAVGSIQAVSDNIEQEEILTITLMNNLPKSKQRYSSVEDYNDRLNTKFKHIEKLFTKTINKLGGTR